MMNTNTMTATTNNTSYINYEMNEEEWAEVLEEALGTVEKHPRRVRKEVRNNKVNVEDFSSKR